VNVTFVQSIDSGEFYYLPNEQVASLREGGSHAILRYFGVWGYFWGYLATSGANSDVTFLLNDVDFPYGRRNFAPISLIFQDMTRTDRHTDRRDNGNRRFSQCKCASIKRHGAQLTLGARHLCPKMYV